MKKTEPLPMRVDPETKRMAADMAEALGISVSAYVRMLIRLDNKKANVDNERRKE